MIEICDLSLHLPGFTIRNLNFEVPDGHYAVLMGRTGCGKTTVLEAICGLRHVNAGRIVLHGRDITHDRPGRRNIGYVPQDGAMFPTMSVRKQIEFPMRLRHWSRQTMSDRVDELAALIGIEQLLQRKPRALSGGEKQRVALARALSFRPSILCLDEPLSALDEETRERMCNLLEQVREHEQVTALHITHNPSEAARLATQRLVFEDGQVISQ